MKNKRIFPLLVLVSLSCSDKNQESDARQEVNKWPTQDIIVNLNDNSDVRLLIKSNTFLTPAEVALSLSAESKLDIEVKEAWHLLQPIIVSISGSQKPLIPMELFMSLPSDSVQGEIFCQPLVDQNQKAKAMTKMSHTGGISVELAEASVCQASVLGRTASQQSKAKPSAADSSGKNKEARQDSSETPVGTESSLEVQSQPVDDSSDAELLVEAEADLNEPPFEDEPLQEPQQNDGLQESDDENEISYLTVRANGIGEMIAVSSVQPPVVNKVEFHGESFEFTIPPDLPYSGTADKVTGFIELSFFSCSYQLGSAADTLVFAGCSQDVGPGSKHTTQTVGVFVTIQSAQGEARIIADLSAYVTKPMPNKDTDEPSRFERLLDQLMTWSTKIFNRHEKSKENLGRNFGNFSAKLAKFNELSAKNSSMLDKVLQNNLTKIEKYVTNWAQLSPSGKSKVLERIRKNRKRIKQVMATAREKQRRIHGWIRGKHRIALNRGNDIVRENSRQTRLLGKMMQNHDLTKKLKSHELMAFYQEYRDEMGVWYQGQNNVSAEFGVQNDAIYQLIGQAVDDQGHSFPTTIIEFEASDKDDHGWQEKFSHELRLIEELFMREAEVFNKLDEKLHDKALQRYNKQTTQLDQMLAKDIAKHEKHLARIDALLDYLASREDSLTTH